MTAEPTSHTFMAHNLKLHYLQWGDREAPTLLLMHGGRDHAHSWDWAAEQLAKDWRIIAPDLRGHGDSAWSPEGNYTILAFIHDLVRLAEHLDSSPLTLVAHSLGGNIALRYSGLYPDKVRRVVSIEGLGLPPKMMAERERVGVHQRTRDWFAQMDALAGKPHKNYATLEEAIQRMRETNPQLSEAKLRHLTRHAVRQSPEGGYIWKFDNWTRPVSPIDLSPAEIDQLWAAITCPVLLCYGEDSWASNPEKDGRARHFRNARVKTFPNAGHWLHHDQFEMFMAELRAFL